MQPFATPQSNASINPEVIMIDRLTYFLMLAI
jgi:hypothetical protein